MGIARFVHRHLVRQTMPALAARYYDGMIESVSDLYLAPFCKEVFGAFPGRTRILDAGTGTGVLPVMLARGNPDYRVVGVDLSEGCLRLGRERAVQEGVAGRVVLVRGDLERCPLDPGSFDLVVSTCSLHHWRRPGSVLRELARLVRASGKVWLLDHSPTATREDRRRWAEKVEAAARVGLFFRWIYSFENRFLSYSHDELAALVAGAGLELTDWRVDGVFWLARAVKR